MKPKSNDSEMLRFKEFDEADPITVSICTITFNHAEFIARSIEGFLDQCSPFRIEIIIYDDASTDGTADIVQEYVRKYPTVIRATLSDRNHYSLGVNPYYAFVFPEARGEFIAICDGDDYWTESEKLIKQVQVLKSDPDTSITFGTVFGDLGQGRKIEFRAGAERDLTPLELKTCPSINTPTTCFRNPFLSAPPQYLRNSTIGDLTVWAILGGMGKGRFLDCLAPVGYRIHEGGIFSIQTKKDKFYMSLNAKICIAAHHSLNGDSEAERKLLSQAVSALSTQLGLGRMVYLTLRNRAGVLLVNARNRFPFIARVIPPKISGVQK